MRLPCAPCSKIHCVPCAPMRFLIFLSVYNFSDDFLNPAFIPSVGAQTGLASHGFLGGAAPIPGDPIDSSRSASGSRFRRCRPLDRQRRVRIEWSPLIANHCIA